jgi:hypothetical protein
MIWLQASQETSVGQMMETTMQDLADHPFSQESIARESGADTGSDRAWSRFCDDCERLLGHDLDGNDVEQNGCGYSLDEAYDVWRSGKTAHAYVAMVGARERYKGEYQK